MRAVGLDDEPGNAGEQRYLRVRHDDARVDARDRHLLDVPADAARSGTRTPRRTPEPAVGDRSDRDTGPVTYTYR